MGVLGLRNDVLFVAHPSSPFYHHLHNQQQHHHHLHDDSVMSDHHHHHHHHSSSAAAAAPLGIGVIPSLTNKTPSCLDEPKTHGGGIHVWKQNPQTQNPNYLTKKPILVDQQEGCTDQMNTLHNLSNAVGVSGGDGDGGSSSTGISTKTCQDCGNQAKKDCSHQRCRTCCKSRGYDCSTHVKSTWVSAARRRQISAMPRQAQSMIAIADTGGSSSRSTSPVKKPRLLTSQATTASRTSTSNTTPPRSYDTISSHHQDASFRESLPRQVQALAYFKCVRVTPISNGDSEYAYQAVVKIGGHVFKGFLYHKGVVSGNDGVPNISDLNLGGSSGGAGRNWTSSSSPIMDTSDAYAASASQFLGAGGTNYGNTVN